MTDFNVSAGQLRSFAEYLHDQVVADLAAVAVQAEQEGCNKSGFTGLLMPFQVAMDALNTVMGTVYNEARDHVYNVAEPCRSPRTTTPTTTTPKTALKILPKTATTPREPGW